MERQIASPIWISRGLVLFLLLSFAEGSMAATEYADRVPALTELATPKSGGAYTERSYKSPLVAELVLGEEKEVLTFCARIRNEMSFAWFVPRHDYFTRGSFHIYDTKGIRLATYPDYQGIGRLKLSDDMFGEIKPGGATDIVARLPLQEVLAQVHGEEFMVQFINGAVPPGLVEQFMNQRQELVSIALSSKRVRARCTKQGDEYRCTFSPEG
jgi:hypothetical protein